MPGDGGRENGYRTPMAPEGSRLAGPAVMLVSAALFGYFGFATSWNHHGITGQFLLFVALLDWTLKLSAIGFLVAAVLTLMAPMLANLIYGLVGLAGAILFIVIAVMGYLDKQHTAMHPLLLVIFAAWNGYASFAGLREVLVRPGPKDPFGLPTE